MRVLWVTNDLPPRTGGIQQFVANLLERVHSHTSVVIGPGDGERAAAHDARQPYRTVRAHGAVQPTPSVRRLVLDVARTQRPHVVVLGATWPLGELAPALRRELGVPVVALSHGLEAGLVQVGLGGLVTRATRGLDAVTTISEFTEHRLRRHVRGPRVVRVPPGVDVDRYGPHVDGSAQRQAWGIPDSATVVGCVSRLVPRKGQDVLVRAWSRLRREHPDAWLVLVGTGPRRRALARSLTRLGPDSRAVMAGPVPWERLPATFAALDVFAMPCRTRWVGTDVEGLGIVYLEAQASGVPVLAGRSGGAPEAVLDGVTGSVVDGRDPGSVHDALDFWLRDPLARTEAGLAGRKWTSAKWSWSAVAERFGTLLDEVVAHRT